MYLHNTNLLLLNYMPMSELETDQYRGTHGCVQFHVESPKLFHTSALGKESWNMRCFIWLIKTIIEAEVHIL